MTKFFCRRECYYILALGILGYFISAISYSIPFLFDDYEGLVWAKKASHNIWSIFNNSPYFYPLYKGYFFLMLKIFGLNNYVGYHFMTSIFPALNAILVYILFRLISKDVILSLASAALFSLFPSNFLTIWWISSIDRTMTPCFMLAAIVFFVLFTRSTALSDVFLSFFFSFLAFLSKPSAMTIPLLISAYLWLFRKDLTRHFSFYLPYLAFIVFLDLAAFIFPRLFVKAPNLSQIILSTFAGFYTLGWHIFTNFLNYLPSLFMFDIINYPLIPFHKALSVAAIFLISSYIIVDITVHQRTSLRFFSILLFLFGIFLSVKFGLSALIIFSVCSFFLYFFIVGCRLERFCILWLCISILPFLPFNALWGTSSRYLYIPSVGASAFLVFFFRKSTGQIINFIKSERLLVSVRLARVFVIASMLLGILFFGYNKFMDKKTGAELFFQRQQHMIKDVPRNGLVIFVNPRPSSYSTDSFWLSAVLFDRQDIEFLRLTVNSDTSFYLGNAYFINFSSKYSCNSLPRAFFERSYSYNADFTRDIKAVHFKEKIYHNVRGVVFHRDSYQRRKGLRLMPNDKVTIFLVSAAPAVARIRVRCSWEDGLNKVIPMQSNLNGNLFKRFDISKQKNQDAEFYLDIPCKDKISEVSLVNIWKAPIFVYEVAI